MQVRKIILLSIIIFICGSLQADPDDGILDLYMENMELVDPIDKVCLSVTVDDFESVSLIQIPVQWDPTKLVYIGLENEAFSGSVKVPDQENGTLRYIVQDASLSNPLNLDDGAVIFDICFDVLFTACEKTDVTLEDINEVQPPFPFEAIDEDGETIESKIENGGVEIICLPLSICVDAQPYIVGDTNCVSIFTSNFEKIQTFQFSLDYDPAKLSFTGVINLNTELPITEYDFNLPVLGNLRVSWFDFTGMGITLMDCDVIAEVCFDVLTATTPNNPVTINGNIPGGMEATDIDNNILVVNTDCGCMVTTIEQYEIANFVISPNPVTDNLVISLDEFGQSVRLEVIDINGRVVLKKILESPELRTRINTSELSSGVYFLQIMDSEKKGTKRFVKI